MLLCTVGQDLSNPWLLGTVAAVACVAVAVVLVAPRVVHRFTGTKQPVSQVRSSSLYPVYTMKLARRAGSTSARTAASWMFAILHHSNDQTASSSSQLYERTTCALRAHNVLARRAGPTSARRTLVVRSSSQRVEPAAWMLAISNVFDIASIHAAGSTSARRALDERSLLNCWSVVVYNTKNLFKAEHIIIEW